MPVPLTQNQGLIDFQVHTVESAPEGAKVLLQNTLDNYGMIPNLHGIMAESPQTYQSYLALTEQVMESSFTPAERHVLWLAINVENRCHYCVPAHTMIAKQDGVDEEIIEAVRNRQSISDARLETLRQFALKVLAHRGRLTPEDVSEFFDAGFTKRQVLEVVLVLAHKVTSNFINALAGTELDPAFARYAWNPNYSPQALGLDTGYRDS